MSALLAFCYYRLTGLDRHLLDRTKKTLHLILVSYGGELLHLAFCGAQLDGRDRLAVELQIEDLL